MAISDDTITATTELKATNGSGGATFASINPVANKAYFLGKIGIGVLNPANPLDVEGAVAVGASYSGTSTAPTNGLIVEGNVGIGTPSPLASLDVAGTLKTSQSAYLAASGGNVGIGTISPLAKLQVSGGALMPSAGNSSNAGILFPLDPGGGAGDAAWMRYYPRSGESMTLEIGISNDADDHIALTASGNVGISTLSPVNKLDVNGDIAVRGKHAFRGSDSWLRLNQDGAFPSGVHTPGNFAPNSLNVGGVAGWGNPGTGNAWIAGTLTVGANPVRFTSGWTGFPDATSNQAEISNDTGTYRTLMIVGNKSAGLGRRVSIWDRLEVNGFMQATGGAILNGVAVGAPTGSAVAFPYPYETVGVTNTAYNLRLHSANCLYVHTGNSGTPAFQVDAQGRIGTLGWSPTPRTPGWGGGIHTWDIEAEGTMWSRHGYQSGNRDLAENYISEEPLQPGEVVCIDPNHDGIMKASKPNDQTVLGVISTKPGFLLNVDHEAEGASKHFPVALCGRVPCNVVNENGPIQKGDLLTTSSTPGQAMKAKPVEVGGNAFYRPGTIIGKALEAFTGKSGTIEVFVFSS